MDRTLHICILIGYIERWRSLHVCDLYTEDRRSVAVYNYIRSIYMYELPEGQPQPLGTGWLMGKAPDHTETDTLSDTIDLYHVLIMVLFICQLKSHKTCRYISEH